MVPEKQMLDLKKWFDSKHYMRLWNVGPPGLLFSLAIIHGLHHAEQAFLLKTFSLSSGWFFALITLTTLDALILLFWVLFSLPPKNRGIKLSKKGVYGFVRHPIYTAIVYHIPILCALSWGSYLILLFLPVHHIIWGKLVEREEKYLIGIFGQEYLHYMNEVPRFIPWPKPRNF